MAESVASRLKQLRQRAGLSVRGMAEGLGMHPSSYVWYETAYRKAQLPPELVTKLIPILRARGIEPGALASLVPHVTVPDAEMAAEMLPFANLARNVPVYGVAVGGKAEDETDEDRFILNGEVIDRVRRPPQLANAQGVFAIFVAGSSMEPRYEPGDLVYVSATQPARIGDDVLVELEPAREGAAPPCFIKRLVRRGPTALICAQYNPPRELSFDLARIRRVHRVLRLSDLLGA